MTFAQESLRDKPSGLFVLDDPAPFLNYTGSTAGSFVGSGEQHSVSLTSGALFSQKADATHQLSFPTSVYTRGQEGQSFSMEATVRIVRGATSGPIQILSHQNQFDGLSINGTVITFTTAFQTAGSASCSFDFQQDQAVHVVGVHTDSRNQLYLNGVLVSEVDLTDAQKTDVFTYTDTALYSGYTTAGDKVLINGVAFYNTELSADSIQRHFMASANMPVAEEVAATFSGHTINPGIDQSAVAFDRWWSTEEDWKLGGTQNIAVLNDRIQPQFTDDTSISSSWFTSMDLTVKDVTKIESVNVFWSGHGATIQGSLDGVTWTTLTNATRIPFIPPGFDPTDKSLFIKITFPGGIVNDDSYIDNLNIVSVKNSAIDTVSGHSMSFASASQRREYIAQVLHDNNGVVLATGSTMKLLADTSEQPTVIRTIEFWLKSTSSTQPTISVTGTKYINGAVNAGSYPLNEWCLVHIVAASDVAGDITISGPVQLGNISIYPSALTASDITELYNQYFGLGVLPASDTSVVQIQDYSTPVKIITGDWVNLSTN